LILHISNSKSPLTDEPSPAPYVTESEMFLFLVIIIRMGHGICYSLKDCSSTAEEFLQSFYGKAIGHGRFLLIPRCLCYTNNGNALDNNNPSYDTL
jgi:hypothetical protein